MESVLSALSAARKAKVELASCVEKWDKYYKPCEKKRTIEIVQDEVYATLESCNRQENFSMTGREGLKKVSYWMRAEELKTKTDFKRPWNPLEYDKLKK